VRQFIVGLVLLGFSVGISFAEETVHTVKKGETIYSIALSYGVSTDALVKLNNITDPAKLKAGQKLTIPEKLVVTPPVRSSAPASDVKLDYTEYTAIRNDTLFGIARKNNVPLSDLLSYNGLSTSYILKTGDKLRIPLPSTPLSAAPGVAPKPGIKWPVTARTIAKAEGKLAGGLIITSYAAEIVRSLTAGTVKSAGPYLSYKRVVIVQSTAGLLYIYGGCETLSVKAGDRVGPGTELGRLGTTRDPHLLLMVSRNEVTLDPETAPRD
jgi:LysM repeat protein